MAKVLTPTRRARLEMLATYLEGLSADYQHFDMTSYLVPDTTAKAVHYARKNGGVASCGTVACAVGHGPAAGVLVPPRFVGHGVDWPGYEEFAFTGRNERLHGWLFSGGWGGVDDTHYGAAARIRYLLDNGSPPPRFKYPGREWAATYARYRVSDTRPKDEDPAQTGASLASGAVPATPGDAPKAPPSESPL